MAQLDRPSKCDIAEYEMAYQNRLQAGRLSESEILTLYLRLVNKNTAIKIPVLTFITSQNMANLAVSVMLLNEDLKPVKGVVPTPGIVVDGVWDHAGDTHRIVVPDENGGYTRTHQGVFRQYDDGIDMSLFDKELVGASVIGTQDLGAFKI